MITVNTKEHPWHKGMTVRTVIEEKGYTFTHLVVRVNGTPLPENLYDRFEIHDGDEVLILHLMAGG